MKLDKIRFAMLIGFISKRYSMTIIGDDIAEIDRIIDVEMPEPEQRSIVPEQLHVLMALMHEGNQKIEAIKQYRMMTGYGLKDSKDIIEKYWWPDKLNKS